MKTSQAHLPTAHAVSYMKQLCRHWPHKFPVTFDDTIGTIDLPETACRLTASPEALEVVLDMAEEADQPRMEDVVARHLQRFGFREELDFNWTRRATNQTSATHSEPQHG